MQCWRKCPMMNQFEYCEAAGRRAEHVRECPHRKMRTAVQRNAAANVPRGVDRREGTRYEPFRRR